MATAAKVTRKITPHAGRKRIIISKPYQRPIGLRKPVKNKTDEKKAEGKSCLESLPSEILFKIFCKTNHADLKSLFHVSKKIRAMTLMARNEHFSFTTPVKPAMLKPFSNLNNPANFDEEVPNAPRHHRTCRSPTDRNRLAGLAVALFHSPGLTRKLENMEL